TASLAVQEKLLRAIEYGSFARVGGNETISVDVRVIAATNADLPALAEGGKFRADLLDRLAFDVVRLPPLRERGEDIVLLAEHFATRMTAALGRAYFAGFAPEALAALAAHPWPGNVRELRNAIERSVCRLTRPERALSELVLDPFGRALAAPAVAIAPPPPPAAPEAGGLRAALHALEARMLSEALAATRFNQRQAAARLGLGYDQFRRHLRAHPELRR
ncbi:MAG: sigma 54-interacting transcriptional regulator, partial [Rhodospirillales bacterium]|nr:sigma 54-interacting transcriptional regulator [Rhodospirillales bacterium]